MIILRVVPKQHLSGESIILLFILVVKYSMHAMYSFLIAPFFSICISQWHAILSKCSTVYSGKKNLKSDL